jgi:hypothetical protein
MKSRSRSDEMMLAALASSPEIRGEKLNRGAGSDTSI